MTSCLPIIGQAKVTPIGRILSDSPAAESGAKSDVYGCLLLIVVAVAVVVRLCGSLNLNDTQ